MPDNEARLAGLTGVACQSGRVGLVANPGLDIVDHVFADDGFAMRFAHVLDRAANHLGVILGAGVPGATRHERTTFEQSHIFLLIFQRILALQRI